MLQLAASPWGRRRIDADAGMDARVSDEARARIAAFMDAVALFAGGSYRRATQHKNSSGISRRAMFAEAVTCGRLCRRDSPNPRPARQDPHRGPAANRPRRWHVGSTVY